MQISILNPTDFKTSTWAGGTTTQLYISPLDSNYLERSFDYRISSARIEIEASNFTSLPAVQRKLMILDGEITIKHQNQYSKKLKAFDQDSFDGSWNTSTIGKCTDFNVMTTGNKQSKLFSEHLSKNEKSTISFEKNWKTLLIFVLNGECEIEKHSVSEESLFVITDLSQYNFTIKAIKSSSLIVTLIN